MTNNAEHVRVMEKLRARHEALGYGPVNDAEIAALTAAIAALKAAEWQPIESAPRDSQAKLVYVPLNKCIFCVSWRSPIDEKDALDNPEGWYYFGCIGCRMYYEPTHWMPLPPPKESE